ncbi:MAG TPA: hypothetical protein VIH27_03330 [Nitrososphaerales archaeon]
MKPWIGVDLDGTLAEYYGWKGIDHIGDPIPLMVDRVIGWLSDGNDVKIFTARICEDQDGKSVEEIKTIIQDWCEKHIGIRLEVTNIKDFGMVELWDDRCFQVEANTGKLVEE